MPTVAVDARELAGRPTGVGRYLLELLKKWRDPATWHDPAGSPRPRHTFILYSHQPFAPATPFADRAVVLEGTGGTRWEQATFARALRHDRPDVLFAPASTAPLAVHLPIALTIHDLSYAAHPEWFRWREGARRRLLTRLSARKASVVLTVSAFSAGEIVERLGVPASKVRVVYHGASYHAQDEAEASHHNQGSYHSQGVWREASSSREPLVLFVGSLFNRRRIPDLLHAFAHVARHVPEARLALVGDNRTYPREEPRAIAAALGIADRVDVHDYPRDDEVLAFYRRASVFVFVSEYEGFGLTPLDALAFGVPIVVADTPLSREIYADAAVTAPIGDAHALGEAILTLLQHPVRRRAALAAAPAVLARYSWDRAAADTLAAIEQAARPERAARVEG
ncbi:MAG: glycosyltransferase family 4 protein [Vicinamibacterales bacterium]